jgi:putative addiction module component (TIGR02574 family)
MGAGFLRKASHFPVFESEVNMPATFNEIAQQARQLQPEERARLAEMLLASLQEPMPSDIGSAWDHEVAERVAAYQAGSMESFPAEDVFTEAKRIAR